MILPFLNENTFDTQEPVFFIVSKEFGLKKMKTLNDSHIDLIKNGNREKTRSGPIFLVKFDVVTTYLFGLDWDPES